jgi:hypothetical protein
MGESETGRVDLNKRTKDSGVEQKGTEGTKGESRGWGWGYAFGGTSEVRRGFEKRGFIALQDAVGGGEVI